MHSLPHFTLPRIYCTVGISTLLVKVFTLVQLTASAAQPLVGFLSGMSPLTLPSPASSWPVLGPISQKDLLPSSRLVLSGSVCHYQFGCHHHPAWLEPKRLSPCLPLQSQTRPSERGSVPPPSRLCYPCMQNSEDLTIYSSSQGNHRRRGVGGKGKGKEYVIESKQALIQVNSRVHSCFSQEQTALYISILCNYRGELLLKPHLRSVIAYSLKARVLKNKHSIWKYRNKLCKQCHPCKFAYFQIVAFTKSYIIKNII